MEFEIINKIFEDENPKSIFEVGCTAGSLFQDYAQDNKLIVGGMDIFPVQAAKDTYAEYADNFFQWDATKIPWPIPDNSYDIVFTIGTLLLIPNPFPVIREMLRICKDKIIIAEQHNEDLNEWGIETNFKTNESRVLKPKEVQDPYINYTRITRNYEKVFKKLKKPYKVSGILIDKTIFKCKK